MNIGSWLTFRVPNFCAGKRVCRWEERLKGILEMLRAQPMEVLFIYEPVEEIGMPSGRKGGPEKG